MIILAWILLFVGLTGIAGVVGVSISEVRHKRRLRKMRAEADKRRDPYYVLYDKRDAVSRRPRAKFLP
jgi:hypothetical protein